MEDKTRSLVTQLPFEIWYMIIRFLPYNDVKTLYLVCRYFQQLLKSASVFSYREMEVRCRMTCPKNPDSTLVQRYLVRVRIPKEFYPQDISRFNASRALPFLTELTICSRKKASGVSIGLKPSDLAPFRDCRLKCLCLENVWSMKCILKDQKHLEAVLKSTENKNLSFETMAGHVAFFKSLTKFSIHFERVCQGDVDIWIDCLDKLPSLTSISVKSLNGLIEHPDAADRLRNILLSKKKPLMEFCFIDTPVTTEQFEKIFLQRDNMLLPATLQVINSLIGQFRDGLLNQFDGVRSLTIDNTAPKALWELPSITSLHLNRFADLSISKPKPLLQELTVTCSHLSRDFLCSLHQHYTSLQKLVFDHCTLSQDLQKVFHLIDKIPKLQILELHYLSNTLIFIDALFGQGDELTYQPLIQKIVITGVSGKTKIDVHQRLVAARKSCKGQFYILFS